MELGPICRALTHNIGRVVLIVAQVALTLAVTVNCVVMMQDTRKKLARPTGIDEDHLLLVTSKTFDKAFEDDAYVEHAYDEDLRALRALPGVRAATGIGEVPLSGGGSSTGRRPLGSEREAITAPYFNVGDQALETLGVELVAGRDFEPGEFVTIERFPLPEDPQPTVYNVIVTQALADELFPDGDALGQLIVGRNNLNNQNRIVGILERMHCSWPLSRVAERAMLIPGRPGSGRQTTYLVRTEPGMREGLIRSVTDELERVNQGRIVEVQTMTEIKRGTYGDLISVNKMLGGMIVLLLLVTALGVIGLTAFSVTQRTRQIGTRRALGATRFAVVRHFLVENWVVTTAGLVLGVALTYGLNYFLASSAEVPRVGFSTLAAGMLGLWVVGALAALAPALRGARVSPVIATRTV